MAKSTVFGKSILKEYFVVMQERHKWQHPQRGLVEGDVVIIREENVPHNASLLALVV